ncbi:MAG: GNAT family N-acetyltransferase, partial [Nitrososphaerales archaeon]
GVGPLTIDPDKQNSGVGRSLMQAVVDHALEQNFQGIRLIAATFHNRAFGLYTKLGFDVREQLAVLHGSPIAEEIPECHVRQAAVSDLEECNKLCFRIHGFDRGGELNDSINRGKAVVVGREGRISGYSTGVTFIGHSIAETNQDLKALIGAAPSLSTGFLIPVSNSEVLRWCLDKGLQISRPMTLMSLGTYNEPTGPFLPSLLY